MSKMRRRSFEMRAMPDQGEGVVEGYITTFGNDYNIGWGLRERILPETFDESMSARGNVLPIMYQHDHQQPPIGVATLSRDDKGIKARTELFMDDPRARATWRAMQAGALREWSIGFTADPASIRAERDVEVVERGDLMEASVVLRGANPATETLSVRSEERRTARLEARTREVSPEDAQQILGWLVAIDAIVDEAQEQLAAKLGVPNPDDDDDADEPADEAPAKREIPAEWLDRMHEPHIRRLIAEFNV